MTDEQKHELKHRIQKSIAKLREQIVLLQERTNPVAPDCSLGRLTRMEAIAEQEVNRKILDEATVRLTRLNHALARIDRPSFGICIECDEPIDLERLTIRPESVRCVACANER